MAVRLPASAAEETYLRLAADWFAPVQEFRGDLRGVLPGGLLDGWEAEQFCCRHSALPARVARAAVEQSEADPAGSIRAPQRVQGQQRPSLRGRCSQALHGARLQARSVAPEHWRAACRHCS